MPVTVASALAAAFASVFESGGYIDVLVFGATNLLLALGFVGVVLAVSAVAETGWRTLSAAFGVVVFLVFVGPPSLALITVSMDIQNEVIQSLVTVFPTRAYDTILSLFLDAGDGAPSMLTTSFSVVSLTFWVLAPVKFAIWTFSKREI